MNSQDSGIIAKATHQLIHLTIPLLLFSGGVMSQPLNDDPALRLIRGGGTPAVFSPSELNLSIKSCPEMGNAQSGDIQPLRLMPTEVIAKNTLGCLSPNDAIYGADGCPTRLCGQKQGTIQLPAERNEEKPL